MGVWIEILVPDSNGVNLLVTPCVGVWIEIIPANLATISAFCHSLCGSVD